MSKTITVQAEVRVPQPPNFLRYEDETIDVADISDDSLRALGTAWTDQLLENAAARRRARGTTTPGGQET